MSRRRRPQTLGGAVVALAGMTLLLVVAATGVRSWPLFVALVCVYVFQLVRTVRLWRAQTGRADGASAGRRPGRG